MANSKKKSDKWHWSLTVLILSWFICFPTILIHGFGPTRISIIEIVGIVLASGLLSLLIQTPLFNNLRKKEGGEKFVVGKQLFVIYNIFGVGLISGALFLQLNVSFKGSDFVVEEYEIIKIDPDYRPGSYSGIVYILEDGKFQDEVDYRWFDVMTNPMRSERPFVRYEIYTGLFGFKIMGDRYLVSGPDDEDPRLQPYL